MEVSNTTLALSAAVVFVLLLLTSCDHNQVRAAPTQRRFIHDDSSDGQYAKWGQGVRNRDADARVRNLSRLTGYDDYNKVAQYQSLDKEVFDSHRDYTKNLGGLSSAVASNLSEPSHDNYPTGFVGLRRPDMRSAYASSSARQQNSQYIDQLPTYKPFMI